MLSPMNMQLLRKGVHTPLAPSPTRAGPGSKRPGHLAYQGRGYSTTGNKGLKPSTCSLVTYEMQVPPFPVVTCFKSEDGAIIAMNGPLCSWITR